MNRTTTIYTVLFWIILVLFAYILVMQPKVKAGNEILDIQQRLIELDDLEQQAKDNWHDMEWFKDECIESWNQQQKIQSTLAEWYRAEKSELENRLGLLLQR